MGVFFEDIPDNVAAWISTQKILWVATAPLSASGHVNVSPKGGASFGVLDRRTFWYMDLTGSGIETIAHLRENGRITIMFSAFEGPPRIVRLWGTGKVIERGTRAYDAFVAQHHIETIPATRSIIVVDVHQAGGSCGFSVPYFEFKDFRKTLEQTFEKREKDFRSGDLDKAIDKYWAYKNAWSVDGLPGMETGLDTAKREGVKPIEKMVGPLAPPNPFGPGTTKLHRQMSRTGYGLLNLVLVALVAFVLGLVAAPQGVSLMQTHAPQLAAYLQE